MKTNNIADSKKYKENRKEIEKSSKKYSISPDPQIINSPSGNYKLTIYELQTEKGYWNYSKGVITDLKTDEEIFTILRNYDTFLYQWIGHQNGNEYLLCGEDYQGYICLNLTEKKRHVYFPEKWPFCWISVEEYDKKYDNSIIIEGCHWGDTYQRVEYDLSNPDELPYKELSREYIKEEWEDDEDDEE